MKKTLLALGVFCLTNSTFAQTTVNFDELILPFADTAWLGIDQSGGFTSGGVFFKNTYNTQYNYWTEFVYSNAIDVTTPGSSNGHSAYAGGGANGSSNYAVNNGGNIDFGSEKVVTSIDITNNTYAALSMLNGDAFAKQFGSFNNAQGNPDGTNGEDWFRLNIIGRDKDNIPTGTVVFYLADYRFPNSSSDYIINTWETVDLTPLGNIRYLNFVLESSDQGTWGMNTPSYFALDNLVYDNVAGINENILANVEIYPNPTNGLTTVVAEKGSIRILSITGNTVLETESNGKTTIDLTTQPAGIYFVETSNSKGVNRTRIVKK